MYNNSNSNRAAGLSPVRSTKQVASFVTTIVGSAISVPGIILLIIGLFLVHPAAVLALSITGGALLFSGGVVLIVAFCINRSHLRYIEELEMLKSTGISYPAEITRLVSTGAVVRGGWNVSVSVIAECTYTNNEGKTCFVRSKSFMHRLGMMPFVGFPLFDLGAPPEGLYHAYVYVNQFDPGEYAVEILLRI